jgi:hypothetical protein
MWYEILHNDLIGPYVLGGCLTALYYKKFLDNEVLLCCSEDVPLATQTDVVT